MTHTNSTFITAVLGLALATLPAAVLAQDADAPPASEAQSQEQGDDAQDDTQTTDDAPPDSLDELLGLEEDEDTERAEDAAQAQRDAELERALINERIEDNFKEAIALMSSSVTLLSEEFDAGLGTQRVQEDIIKKLDDLINNARQQQSSSSSSSSSSQQQNQQQQPRQQQQNQQEGESQNQNSDNAMQQEATTVQQLPDEAVDISQLIDETRIEWGALPDRERQQLLQALKDRPSVLYRRLTSDYFKRLAETD